MRHENSSNSRDGYRSMHDTQEDSNQKRMKPPARKAAPPALVSSPHHPPIPLQLPRLRPLFPSLPIHHLPPLHLPFPFPRLLPLSWHHPARTAAPVERAVQQHGLLPRQEAWAHADGRTGRREKALEVGRACGPASPLLHCWGFECSLSHRAPRLVLIL